MSARLRSTRVLGSLTAGVAAAGLALVVAGPDGDAARRPQRSTPPPSASTPHAKTFSGGGPGRLGTVRVGRLSRLSWHHPLGGPLRVVGSRRQLLLSDRRVRGQLRLRPGIYRDLRVATRGRWRIVIR